MSDQEFHQIALDYPARPRPRALHVGLRRILDGAAARHAHWVAAIVRMRPWLEKLPVEPSSDARVPCWVNGWLPALDGASLYTFIAARRPRVFLEIGSGWSTRFARRAVEDHRLTTRIVSIDPQPRVEIDALCDEVIRQPLEDCNLDLLDELSSGDVVFADNSHRCLMNSDVTVFFTDVLPRLPAGVLAGVHDLFLPDDYPAEWIPRFYSEQYLMATLLLAGPAWLRVEFAAYHVFRYTDLCARLAWLWDRPGHEAVERHGNGFWLQTTGARRPWRSSRRRQLAAVVMAIRRALGRGWRRRPRDVEHAAR